MIYSASGVAEQGCVFTTDDGGDYGQETWVVFCYMSNEKIGFVRTGKHRTTLYEIFLQSKGTGTVIRWCQQLTALDSRGDELVATFSQERFESIMMTKERWVIILKSSGFSEEDMRNCHIGFERTSPDRHRKFLQYLGLRKNEIAEIRHWAKEG